MSNFEYTNLIADRKKSIVSIFFCLAMGAQPAQADSNQNFLDVIYRSIDSRQAKSEDLDSSLRDLFLKSSGKTRGIYALAIGAVYSKSDPKSGLLYLGVAAQELASSPKIMTAVSYYRALALTAVGDFQRSVHIAGQYIANEQTGFGWRKNFHDLLLTNLRLLDSRDQFIEYYKSYVETYPAERLKKSWAIHFIDSLGEDLASEKAIAALESMILQYPHGPESSWALRKLIVPNCQSTTLRSIDLTAKISPKSLVSLARTGDLDEGLKPLIGELLVQKKTGKTSRLVESLVRAKLSDDAMLIANSALLEAGLISNERDEVDLRVELAKALYKNYRYLDVDKVLLSLKEKFPEALNISHIMELQADNYYRLGAYSLASSIYERLATRHPSNRHYGWRAFFAAYLSKDYAAASQYLATIASRGSSDREGGIDVKFWSAKIAAKQSVRDAEAAHFESLYSSYGESIYGILAILESGRTLKPFVAVNGSRGPESITALEGPIDGLQEKIETDLGLVEVFLNLGMIDAAKNHMAGLSWSDRDENEALVLGQFAFAVENFRAGTRAASRLNWQDVARPKSIDGLLEHRASVPMWQLLYPFAYRSDVESISAALDLDPFFILAIMRAESHFNPEARSPVGAKGLMQLMPATAIRIARLTGDFRLDVQSLGNPRLSIGYGAYYLKKLLNYYGGNYGLAAAAYNAGPFAVNAWLESCSSCSFAEFVEFIPFRETRQYVKKIIKNLVSYRSIYNGPDFSLRDLEMPKQLPDGEQLF